MLDHEVIIRKQHLLLFRCYVLPSITLDEIDTWEALILDFSHSHLSKLVARKLLGGNFFLFSLLILQVDEDNESKELISAVECVESRSRINSKLIVGDALECFCKGIEVFTHAHVHLLNVIIWCNFQNTLRQLIETFVYVLDFLRFKERKVLRAFKNVGQESDSPIRQHVKETELALAVNEILIRKLNLDGDH